jgi:hypothetical protein
MNRPWVIFNYTIDHSPDDDIGSIEKETDAPKKIESLPVLHVETQQERENSDGDETIKKPHQNPQGRKISGSDKQRRHVSTMKPTLLSEIKNIGENRRPTAVSSYIYSLEEGLVGAGKMIYGS